MSSCLHLLWSMSGGSFIALEKIEIMKGVIVLGYYSSLCIPSVSALRLSRPCPLLLDNIVLFSRFNFPPKNLTLTVLFKSLKEKMFKNSHFKLNVRTKYDFSNWNSTFIVFQLTGCAWDRFKRYSNSLSKCLDVRLRFTSSIVLSSFETHRLYLSMREKMRINWVNV